MIKFKLLYTKEFKVVVAWFFEYYNFIIACFLKNLYYIVKKIKLLSLFLIKPK